MTSRWISVVALDRKLLRVAVAAEYLDRLGRLSAGDRGGEQLRHRTGLGVRPPLLAQPGCPVDEHARRLDLGRHVGQLPLNRLEVADALPELSALERVCVSDVVGCLSDPKSLCGDPDPSAVERRHGDAETLSLLAEQALLAHLHPVEDDVCGRARVKPELLLLA